jgi:hypothetical protein
VARAKPDVIVHQLTAIGAVDMRHFDRAAQRPRGTTRDARAGFVSGSKVAGRAASFLDLAMTTYSGYSMRSRQATADVHGQGDDRAPVASAGCSSSMVHRSQSRMWIARFFERVAFGWSRLARRGWTGFARRESRRAVSFARGRRRPPRSQRFGR